MSTEQFIASLVHSLAWPGAVVGVAVLFRQQVGDLLSGSLRKLKAGPIEFEFDRIISSVEAELTSQVGTELPRPHGTSLVDDLGPVALASPGPAVLEAYSRLERELLALTKPVAGGETSRGAIALSRLALEHKLHHA
jgi:hypothetical protein